MANECTKWTFLATQCYQIHCICHKCNLIPNDIKKFCKMKKSVLKLYVKLGKPKHIGGYNESIYNINGL